LKPSDNVEGELATLAVVGNCSRHIRPIFCWAYY